MEPSPTQLFGSAPVWRAMRKMGSSIKTVLDILNTFSIVYKGRTSNPFIQQVLTDGSKVQEGEHCTCNRYSELRSQFPHLYKDGSFLWQDG